VINHGRINKIDNDNKKNYRSVHRTTRKCSLKVSIPGVIRDVAPNEVTTKLPL
jgi:hypothetical protein